MLARSVSLISSVSKLTSRLLHTNIHVMCELLLFSWWYSFSSGPHLIKMPCVTHHMTEGELARWCKKDGDTIKPHDLICEVRTDKTLYGMENEEEEDWLLVKTLVREFHREKNVFDFEQHNLMTLLFVIVLWGSNEKGKWSDRYGRLWGWRLGRNHAKLGGSFEETIRSHRKEKIALLKKRCRNNGWLCEFAFNFWGRSGIVGGVHLLSWLGWQIQFSLGFICGRTISTNFPG